MSVRPSERATDPLSAARRAEALSGHPDGSWSIVLVADLQSLSPVAEFGDRIRAAVGANPRLGPPPEVRHVTDEAFAPAVTDVASRRYSVTLIRLVACDDPVPRVAVAAHHSALDGLGLLALLGIGLGCDIRSDVHGLDERGGGRGFVAAAFARATEAAFRPSVRVAPDGAGSRPGDHLISTDDVSDVRSAAAVAAAVARAIARWNGAHRRPTAPVVMSIGASRRSGAQAGLEDGSAYLRIRTQDGRVDAGTLAASMRAVVSETGSPTRPVAASLASAASRILRPLSSRMGSTALVSSLGRVDAPGVTRLAFYPVAYGRAAASFGFVRVGDAGTLTLRCRARDLSGEAATRLLRMVAQELDR